MTPTTVRLTEDTHEGLSLLSNLTNRSKSYIINEALKAYLESQSAYLKDLDSAVESIDTQPTYAAEDVFGWMRSWGTEKETSFSESELSNNSPK